MIVIALISGVLVAVVSLALRRDTARARGLRSSGGLVDDRFVFLSLPGFAMLLLGFGALGLAMPLGDSIVAVLLRALAAGVAIIGGAASLWGLFARSVPRFARPRWMRAEEAD